MHYIQCVYATLGLYSIYIEISFLFQLETICDRVRAYTVCYVLYIRVMSRTISAKAKMLATAQQVFPCSLINNFPFFSLNACVENTADTSRTPL